MIDKIMVDRREKINYIYEEKNVHVNIFRKLCKVYKSERPGFAFVHKGRFYPQIN